MDWDKQSNTSETTNGQQHFEQRKKKKKKKTHLLGACVLAAATVPFSLHIRHESFHSFPFSLFVP